jgi:hypothetical protein
MSYLIVVVLCGAIGGGYWWVLGNILGAEAKIEKTKSFATLVPIVPAHSNFPIPMDTNISDSHNEFYTDLLGLASRPDKPPEDWPPYTERKLDSDNGMTFAMRLIQYYSFYSVYRLQRGTSGGTRWTLGVGVTPIERTPIPPPDATPYPNEALIQMLSQSEFLRPGDRMLWKYDTNRLVVPKGTQVSFIEIPAIPEKGQMLLCRIRFERPDYYTLDFDISPGVAQLGNMPAGIVLSRKTLVCCLRSLEHSINAG